MKRLGILLLPLAGCVTMLNVQDVIGLPPPANVQSRRAGQSLTISWQAGEETRVPDFSGYLLYVSSRSLAGTPLAELPTPIVIGRGFTAHTFTIGDSLPLFVQVRSRAGRNRLSLPSLPELVIKPAAP